MIPKYARNKKAASYFINYLCRPDVALRNMDACGYVSAVATPEDVYKRQPLYYARNRKGYSEGWVKTIKNSIAQVAPHYTMKRQLDIIMLSSILKKQNVLKNW